MTKQRVRTARDLVITSGRWPAGIAALAAMNLFFAPPAWAQAPAPAQPEAARPRDPMKPEKKPSDAKVTVSEHMTVDLHVKDEDLANVLELLSIQTQKNIIASKNVAGKVTATLYGVTFYQALDSILHVNGFGYIENGNFIYVYTNEELKQIEAALKKRVSKVIRLNYLNADDAKEFVSPMLSKDGGEIKINQKTKDFVIGDKLPVGKDDFALGATLVVIDFEENIKAIEELIKQIDTRPAQVLVEATILQTAVNEANAFGVDFSIIGDLNFGDFINIGGPLGAAGGLIKGGTGASGQGFSPSRDRGNAITSNPGNTSGPGTFKVGVLAGDVAIFLKMLDQVTDSVILSNPKILALNRQPSRVLVGKRVGYLNTTSTETSTTQTVNFLDTGTQLYFRPFVSSEGEVRMELKPQVSAAEIRNVTDARGAVVTIPDEVTQEIVTNVLVKDGQTVVLGGLFTESSTFTRRQVPWLGDIPILGAAFKGHDDATQRSEIIFLITPTIINDGHLQAQAERASGDVERLRAGARQKLLPWSQDRQTDLLNVQAEKLARDGDYEKAMWNIQRSLSLNAQQPEVYRLRERITGDKERWNDRSLLNEIVDAELAKRTEGVAPSASPVKEKAPWGSAPAVREPVSRPSNMAPGSNNKLSTPATQDSTPVAGVSEQHSSNANPNNSTFAAPASNASASDAEAYASTLANSSSSSNLSVGTYAVAENAQVTTSTTSVASNSAPVHAGKGVFLLNGMNNGQSFGVVSLDAVKSPLVGASVPTFNADPSQNVAVQATTDSPAQPAPAQDSSVQSVQATLTNIRGHIELFSMANNGTLPTLGADQNDAWKPFTEARLLDNVPVNNYVGGANASKIKIADAPDASFSTDYGWIYNPKTGQIWAAGFNASDKPLSKSTAQTPQQAKPATQQATAGELIGAINPNPKSPNPAAGNNPVQPASSTAGVPEQHNP